MKIDWKRIDSKAPCQFFRNVVPKKCNAAARPSVLPVRPPVLAAPSVLPAHPSVGLWGGWALVLIDGGLIWGYSQYMNFIP